MTALHCIGGSAYLPRWDLWAAMTAAMTEEMNYLVLALALGVG
jgi:hypothetical protein